MRKDNARDKRGSVDCAFKRQQKRNARKFSCKHRLSKMAEVATSTRYAVYRPTTSVAVATATAIAPADQVDNNTHETLTTFKSNYINRMNDKYHREDERLKTFAHWPLMWLSKNMLAQTGMFYTNEADKVKCYFCEVEIGRWEHDDQPVPEHLRWSPNCPLLRRRTTNNVPLNVEQLDRVLPPVSYDICGANDAIEVRENAYSEGRIPMARMIHSTGVNTMRLHAGSNGDDNGSGGITSTATQANGDLLHESESGHVGGSGNGCSNNSVCSTSYFPTYPEYAIETARLRSFAEWPRNLRQKPEQLAEAGFFYTGVGDRVRCFSCGGGLKDWDDNDDPWEQHALWLSQCRFVKLMKGQLFIDTVAQAAKPQDNDTTTAAAATTAVLPQPAQCASKETVSTAAQCNSTSTSTSTMVENPLGMSVAAVPAINEGDVAPTMPAAIAMRIHDKVLSQEHNSILQPSVRDALTMSTSSVSIPEEKLCKICFADEYNTAFLPCGHVVACAKCASSVTKCPLCRKPFTDVMRVYFS